MYLLKLIFKIRFISALLASFSLFFTYPAFAFGKLGHQVICQLAFENLSVDKQQKIQQLLASISIADQRLINRYNHQNKDKAITFATACTWADAIKKHKKYKDFNRWHYLNVSRNTTKILPDNCNKPCIANAILFHQRQLSVVKSAETKSSETKSSLVKNTATINDKEKLKALMFLGHWVGDIHQPLHVSYASDLGGNRVKISSGDKCNNLHWYWDECLLISHKNKKKNYQALLLELRGRLNKSEQQPLIKQWQKTDVWQWAQESLNMIRQPEFSYCKLNNNGTCLPLQAKKIKLAENYKSHHQPLLEQRLLQAAVRLSAVLTQSL